MNIVRAGDLNLGDRDLARAAARFGIDELTEIGGFENLVYRSAVPAGRVLRLTHSSRRTLALIEAEFDFMNHLAGQGVPAVAPIRSQGGTLVEEFITESGERLAIVCMDEAPGRHRAPADWSDRDIQAYGALLGAMHASATSHVPTGSRRPPWTDPLFDVGLASCAEAPSQLRRKYAAIVDAARAHPSGAAELLIHRDAHLGNVFLTDAGTITVFDFDDAAYGTATHDVAVVLFYWLFGREIEPVAEVRRFLPRFLEGYERHARLPEGWAFGADLFLSHREVEIYYLLSREATSVATPSAQRFMEGRLERVLAGVPYLGVALRDAVDF